jgi:hypothetical protein
MLTTEELDVIRRRREDHSIFHDVRLAQEDRVKLLAHIDHLEESLAKAGAEMTRLRRSIS